jgi:hypothetical protein
MQLERKNLSIQSSLIVANSPECLFTIIQLQNGGDRIHLWMDDDSSLRRKTGWYFGRLLVRRYCRAIFLQMSQRALTNNHITCSKRIAAAIVNRHANMTPDRRPNLTPFLMSYGLVPVVHRRDPRP